MPVQELIMADIVTLQCCAALPALKQASGICRYDSRGEEGADRCSWKYGETWEAENGALANMKLNGRSYMIQMNWAIGQGCSMGW